MADYSVDKSKHARLAAGVVDTVRLPSSVAEIEVVNRDGAAEIFFTVNGADPDVEADDTLVLPATICDLRVGAGGPETAVRLISSGAVAYSVAVV